MTVQTRPMRDRLGRVYTPAVGPRLRPVLWIILIGLAMLGANGLYLSSVTAPTWFLHTTQQTPSHMLLMALTPLLADPRPGRTLERNEQQEAVLRLIGRLPHNQQEIIRLKFQNGFSYQEISRITSLSVTNVGFILPTALKTRGPEMAAQSLAPRESHGG